MRKKISEHPYLSLGSVLKWVPLMERLGVSEVARSERGFLTAYRDGRIDEWWQRRRHGFIERHMAQLVNNGEPLYDDKGRPTRRHLALIAWAFSPDPRRIGRGP